MEVIDKYLLSESHLQNIYARFLGNNPQYILTYLCFCTLSKELSR